MLEPWQTIESVTSYEDRWLKVRSDRCLTKTGLLIEPYHVIQYPTWVNVVALTLDGEILLVRQYRHGVTKILTELPCGSVEPSDENPQAAARRELQEETGFTGGDFFPLGCTYANPSNQNNEVWSFLAVGVQQSQKLNLDPNEEIEVIRKRFAKFINQVWQGNLRIQGLHVVAIHFAVHFILKSQQSNLAALRQALREELFD